MSQENLNAFELEALQVIVSARDLADKLEAMMVTVMQSRIPEASPPWDTTPPAPIAAPKADDIVFRKAGTDPIHSITIHPNIVQLADPKAVIAWNRDPQSIAELRNYAFMSIAAKSNGTVGFQYLTARNPKTNYMSKMAPSVYETLQVGKIYIMHTIKKSGKNYWDAAISLKMTDTEILARARVLSHFYGKLQEEGLI